MPKGRQGIKEIKEKVTVKVQEHTSVKENSKLDAERNDLVSFLKKTLLTNDQLKRGGPGVRVQYEREKGYVETVNEINILGLKLGYSPVSIGSLRR